MLFSSIIKALVYHKFTYVDLVGGTRNPVPAGGRHGLNNGVDGNVSVFGVAPQVMSDLRMEWK